jgi:hypothetical protein
MKLRDSDELFLGDGDGFTNFSIHRGILNDKMGSSPGLVESYLSCVSQFQPSVKYDCILIGFPASIGEKVGNGAFFAFDSSIQEFPHISWKLGD